MSPVDADAEQWDRYGRSETTTEKLDRNWASLLQELRVVQTGVQLLTGFLLTLPFQPRFDTLDPDVRYVFLGTVSCSVIATVLLIAPVGLHRVLFRRHRLVTLVEAAHRLAYAGLLLLGAALVGTTVVVFDAVVGHRPAVVAGAVAVGAFAGLWIVLPVWMRVFPPNPSGMPLATDERRGPNHGQQT
ncbi:DUF6328 family protein [Mycolicibacterium grossiae]|uniref:Sodium:proton antiporter n=1 Tax=Mycolicibacterium grossiae TaxID=1552759 RepID=A0A1E8QCP5_9MYCO|nr:DUF6328 family protein [Mycolicibacterium grossiae]OFJ55814.1 hypothetical protein BEL07_00630 [Mycolicibacterium grossiae]QEM43419.1 hypothetical protein FZ046_00275 [Mycolicibacterium grossiae]